MADLIPPLSNTVFRCSGGGMYRWDSELCAEKLNVQQVYAVFTVDFIARRHTPVRARGPLRYPSDGSDGPT